MGRPCMDKSLGRFPSAILTDPKSAPRVPTFGWPASQQLGLCRLIWPYICLRQHRLADSFLLWVLGKKGVFLTPKCHFELHHPPM
jgi:hypothetical protein